MIKNGRFCSRDNPTTINNCQYLPTSPHKGQQTTNLNNCQQASTNTNICQQLLGAFTYCKTSTVINTMFQRTFTSFNRTHLHTPNCQACPSRWAQPLSQQISERPLKRRFLVRCTHFRFARRQALCVSDNARARVDIGDMWFNYLNRRTNMKQELIGFKL